MAAITEMRVGDMFERIFPLIGRTASRTTLATAVALFPFVILLAVALHFFIDVLAGILQPTFEGGTPALADFAALIAPGTFVALAALLLTLASGAAQIAVFDILCGEMEGEPVSWSQALRNGISMRLARLVGALLLIGVLFAAAMALPMALSIFVTPEFMFLFVLVVIPGMVWLSVRWVFVVPAIAWEEAGVLASLSRSAYLTREMWWRVLGLFLLFGFVAQFALSIITTPLSFLAMSGFFSSYIRLIMSMGADAKPDPAVIMDMISSMGAGLAVMIGISIWLSTIVQAAYTTVIYYDARARKGEFRVQEPPAAAATPADADDVIDFNLEE